MPDQTLSTDVALAVKKWQKKRGALIMVLHEIQGRHGYVPRAVALELAQQMRVPLARIYEVLTFYNYFILEPPAKYVIAGCLGTACYLKGTNEILGEFSKQLGIDIGETTSDGKFCIQTLRCVGCCGLAPVILVNGQVHSKVSTRDVSNILANCKE